MKINEVPQDHSDKFKKDFSVIEFAVDDEGKYKAVKSSGFEPKNVALEQAWEFEEEKMEKARQLYLRKKKSFIYYHMKKNMMSIKILSGYTGYSWYRVWRDCSFKVGSKLTDVQLETYRYAFGYKSVDEVKKID
ncbi:hypothetical protein [Plebeiibacterium sediminum]|uniref:Uncharacterized protein n=1 Tax=Plebeiibacterium sediminum TaxID=2992112 RepID=A0AAE3SF82_9BACT|nr:hypothetical protein [Plebeiobacterium sediminum]MCW3786782.1 hypothetical protein [Plebeiobacterium sediminum]